MGNIFFSEFKSPCFKTKGAKTLGSSVNFDDGLDVTRGEGAKQERVKAVFGLCVSFP